MRILVADQNALLLAAITATFGKYCDLVTATRRDMCVAYVEQEKFDVVVACDKMADYTGLELLSEVAALSPGTLLIFAASAERLERLSYRLQVFGLLDTLAYPITPRKLLNALRTAREHLPSRAVRKIPHVVLESEWDTGEWLALVEDDLDAAVARHNSGIGENDWVDKPVPNRFLPIERGRRGGADAGSLGDGGVEEFVWIEAMAQDLATEVPAAEVAVTQVPTTQHQRWEVSERQGFVYEAAAVAAIEVMPAEVPVAHARDPLQQVDYEEVGNNDPAFDVPEPLSWAEDGAANDIAFGAEPSGLDPVDGQTLSATLSSGGAWSVSPAWSLDPHPALASPEPDSSLTSAGELMRQGDPAASPAGPIQEGSSPTSPAAAAEKTAAHLVEKCAGATSATKQLPQPRERAPTVPTAAQRAAFERALARRNAERKGVQTDPASNVSRRARKKGNEAANQSADATALSSMSAAAGSGESKSLHELARVATNKRPLTLALPAKKVPKRAVFAVGSGLAAVVLVGVLCFELVRPDHSAVAHQRPTEVTSSQFFSPATTVLAGQGSGAATLVPPSTGQAAPQAAAPPAPVAQNFNPNFSPPDPPPPPPVEQPGPMEPPPPPWARPAEPPDPMSGGGTENPPQ